MLAIIGFALGIVLSQKIAITYEKFLQVEETVVRLTATMQSLELILNKVQPNLGTKTCFRWAGTFLDILADDTIDTSRIARANHELYEAMHCAESFPAEMAVMHAEITRDSAYVLSKRQRLTPKAYDTLVHQGTLGYLMLVTAFLPGITGLISVISATYILYGMYYLTVDLDTIWGGDYELVNIDISELRHFVEGHPEYMQGGEAPGGLVKTTRDSYSSR